MKKAICMILALFISAAFVACEEEKGKSGNKTGGTESEFDTVKSEEVTQEEWNAAWEVFVTASNATAEIEGTSVEYPDDDPYYFIETQTIKVADNKYYEFRGGYETEAPDSLTDEDYYSGEKYVGAVEGVTYQWEKGSDEEEWWIYDCYLLEDFVTLGAAMKHVLVDFTLFVEEDGYKDYYALAEYDGDKGAYVIDYSDQGEGSMSASYEIKIVEGKIVNAKITEEQSYEGRVRERNTFFYTFTYGGATIGELPAVTK